MSLIYRLEHPDTKKGAYHGDRLAHSCGNNQDYSQESLHPAPWCSGGTLQDFGPEHIFGFQSLSDARRWFFDEADLRNWHRRGLRLTIWGHEAPDTILTGKHQIAFTRPVRVPLYLPAYAIHTIDEATIIDLYSDHLAIQLAPKQEIPL